MESRLLKLKVDERLRQELVRTKTKAVLAREIGISTPKLNMVLNDHWEYITRDSLERIADHCNLTVDQMFELVPDNFWRPLFQRGHCTLLRSTPTEVVAGSEFPRYDLDATNVIVEALAQLPQRVHHTFSGQPDSVDATISLARGENCIVIGSPKSNPATELLLSKFFDAVPFRSDLENRSKIPFAFCWQDGSPIAESSSLTSSAVARKQTGNRPGIASRDGVHVIADYCSPEEFQALGTRRGLDCGLIFVANKPFGTDSDVKLIVLAGFSGIGTVAAAHALVKNYRELEPDMPGSCVYGIVQGFYSKRAGMVDGRTFKSFRWKYRHGGRFPIHKRNFRSDE